MTRYKLFVGIDVGKYSLVACCLLKSSMHTSELCVPNTQNGIQGLIEYCTSIGLRLSEVLFCIEDTGYYGMPLSSELSSIRAHYWLIPALEIKRSKGITRGKSDKADARDVAFYGMTHLHKLRRASLPSADLLKLQVLFTEREKVVKMGSILDSVRENEGFLPDIVNKEVTKLNDTAIKAMDDLQKRLEKRMASIVEANPIMKMQFSLMITVPGVGPMTATYIIIVTKCFKQFVTHRKLACHAGIAPFERSSGVSLKQPAHIHHLGNKLLKRLLSTCALNASRFDPETKEYYERKLAQGKAKGQVLNAIRGKTLARIYATIRKQMPYEVRQPSA